MNPRQFKLGPFGHYYVTTDDGVEIVRCISGQSTCVYYKKSRPDIDSQRVRMHYEELCKYGLEKPFDEPPVSPFSLDQHFNMHWGNEVRRFAGYDKDGFPLYEQKWWQNEEVLSDELQQETDARRGFKTFGMAPQVSTPTSKRIITFDN